MPIIAPIDLSGGKKLLTRKQYLLGQIGLSILIIIWISILIFGIFYWKLLTWYYKVLIFIILAFLTPSLDDFKDLLQSYDRYKKEWEEANKTE